MKKTKVLLSLLLLLLLLSPLLLPGVPVAAAEPTQIASTLPADATALEQALYRGLIASEEKIDLSAFHSDSATVGEAMQKLRNSVPELFHIGTAYTVNKLHDTVLSVNPTYTMTGSELSKARAEYAAALSEWTALADSAWSPLEIALFYHDLLCLYGAYDTTYTHYDAYHFLTKGTGVCQSYTLTYIALLSHFNIPVTTVSGTSADGGEAHIWNLVTLGGIRYHVDITWDDALAAGRDYFGRALHTNFLCDDREIMKNGHIIAGYNAAAPLAVDNRYADSPLRDLSEPAAFCGGKVYGIDKESGSFLRYADDLRTAEIFYTPKKADWVAPSGGTYLSSFRSLVAHGSLLYYSNPHEIRTFDPENEVDQLYLTHDGNQIFSMIKKNDRLLCLSAADYTRNQAAVVSAELPVLYPPCPADAHRYEVYAHAEPTYTEDGWQAERCTVCGHTRKVTVPKLTPPSTEDFLRAVAAARNAVGMQDRCRTILAAKKLSVYAENTEETAAARAELSELAAAYDRDVRAIDNDFAVAATMPVRLVSGFFPLPTLLVILLFLLGYRLCI